MFTQPCYIRKNTPELRKELDVLGYNRHPSYSDNVQYLYLNRGFYHTNVVGYTEEIERMIDCGTNEELFLALSALRDDSDYMQWFVYPKTQTKRISGCFGQVVGMDGYYQEIIEHEWIQYNMDDRKLSERIEYRLSLCCCDEEKKFIPHKATIDEIIEHFKNR